MPNDRCTNTVSRLQRHSANLFNPLIGRRHTAQLKRATQNRAADQKAGTKLQLLVQGLRVWRYCRMMCTFRRHSAPGTERYVEEPDSAGFFIDPYHAPQLHELLLVMSCPQGNFRTHIVATPSWNCWGWWSPDTNGGFAPHRFREGGPMVLFQSNSVAISRHTRLNISSIRRRR